MAIVNFPDINPSTNVNKIGLALCGDRNQCHIGIIYKAEGDEYPFFLHLAWHYVLRNDQNVPNKYIWIDLPLDELNKSVMSQYCKHLAIKNSDGNIPYGFNVEGRFFDKTGSWIGEEGVGLTCATFVLAVFRAMSLPLLKTEEWICRIDDREWQENVIRTLITSGASSDHIHKQRSNIGGARFRPSEVMASATSDYTPIGYIEALNLSEMIIEQLHLYNDKINSG